MTKRIKQLCVILFAVLLFSTSFVNHTVQAEKSQDIKFNEYGIKEGVALADLDEDEQGVKAASVSEWIDFASKSNVPLNKVWTVTFNNDVKKQDIEAAVIMKNNELIPVKINLKNNHTVDVWAPHDFSGNTNYTLKLFLSNGKKYRMNFKTVSEPRQADVEPNNNYMAASFINNNETVKGYLSENDKVDFYKVILPEDGTLNIEAKHMSGGNLDIRLYGPNGNDRWPIKSVNNQTTATLSYGLQAGTYYIEVSPDHYGSYTLSTDYDIQTVENDNGASSYIKAPNLELNKTITGHIGYLADHEYGNYNDYFKLDIPEDGTVEVIVKQLSGKTIDLHLYGSKGNDQWSIKSVNNQTTASLSAGLQAGTYYVGIDSNGNYGAYELNVKYTKQEVENDNATSSYITAPLLPLNKMITGHIGYSIGNDILNQKDFFKIEVPRDGKLRIEAEQLMGGELDLHLYGSNGDDNWPIKSSNNKAKPIITEELSVGTYYIEVSNSGYYGGYKLTTTFE